MESVGYIPVDYGNYDDPYELRILVMHDAVQDTSFSLYSCTEKVELVYIPTPDHIGLYAKCTLVSVEYEGAKTVEWTYAPFSWKEVDDPQGITTVELGGVTLRVRTRTIITAFD